ncbi:AaceriAER178WAp [[Ashbya] aceris (nom. inval.)]|nr:AaceriAER178WAp [[Ashbya] aceris (nom. inval.)]
MDMMVINKDDWVYVQPDGDRSGEHPYFESTITSSLRDTKRHALFPPIVREQFIQGKDMCLPIYHDGIKEQAALEYDGTGALCGL